MAELVKRLRPEPRAGLLALRALALSLGPDIVEEVDATVITYRRRDRPFLTVESTRGRLHVLFPPTIPLPDPMGRLLRRGEQRYVRLDGASDMDAHVQDFVRKAYAAVRQ